METDDLIRHLDELIEISKDAEASFETASEIASDERMRTALARGAMRHVRIVHELQSEVRRLGGDPRLSPRCLSPLHRNWIALRAAQRTHDVDGALTECTGCEDQALLASLGTLSRELPERTRALLRRQEQKLRDTLARLRVLRAAPEFAAA